MAGTLRRDHRRGRSAGSRVRAAIAALIAAGVAGGAPAALASPSTAAQTSAAATTSIPQSSCFWNGPAATGLGLTNPETNIGYPDTGAIYWAAEITMPAGSTLTLDGQFANARYESLTAYSPLSHGVISSLNDVNTQPDPGSTNPFEAGASRTATARSYTVTVADALLPAKPAANTLYAGASGQTQQQIMYRIYLPDSYTAADVTGGVGLPTPVLTLANGTVETGAAVCPSLDAVDGPLTTPNPYPLLTLGLYDLWRNQAGQPATFPASSTPVFGISDPNWTKVVCDLFNQCGDYANPDNAYMEAYVNRGFAAGPVLVFHGQLPTTPTTGPNITTMGTGQMRYWSMCQYSMYTTAVVGCVNDSEIPVNAAGQYTIVTSLPQDRPTNATTTCGVAYLPWPATGDGAGHLNDGLIIVRNMLPASTFKNAIQNIATTTAVQSTLGPYYPQGSYTTTAAFQQLGCPA